MYINEATLLLKVFIDFNTEYSLSFRSPRIDVYEKCLEISVRVKFEKDLKPVD